MCETNESSGFCPLLPQAWRTESETSETHEEDLSWMKGIGIGGGRMRREGREGFSTLRR